MCGIVGYVGRKNAQNVILDGLEKLEYRGYDSAGVALIENGSLLTRKHAGRLSNLVESLDENPIKGYVGIGHTRWATHGAPSDINSHPHTNKDGSIAVVHNGIIENYRALKEELVEKGYTFVSETDTEVVAHLIDFYYKGDLLEAVFSAEERLQGAYALGVVAKNNPQEIIAVRNESPLILGIGSHEHFIASDIPAILKYTNKVIYLENRDVVRLTEEGYEVYTTGRKPVQREIKEIQWDVESASKEGFEHFMLKEIYQQPSAIKDTLERRLDENGDIYLENIAIDEGTLKNIDKIYIVGCGTAYHAGLVGKYLLQTFMEVNVIADIASEFRYGEHFIDEKTLVVIVSQSGETADTLAALKDAKSKGARILSITNVVGSSVARESDDVFYTWAGPEIAVASTKAYTTQLICMYLLALYMGSERGCLSPELQSELVEGLSKLPEKLCSVLEKNREIRSIAKQLYMKTQTFFIGRGTDSAVSYEGSLKLKE